MITSKADFHLCLGFAVGLVVPIDDSSSFKVADEKITFQWPYRSLSGYKTLASASLVSFEEVGYVIH